MPSTVTQIHFLNFSSIFFCSVLKIYLGHNIFDDQYPNHVLENTYLLFSKSNTRGQKTSKINKLNGGNESIIARVKPQTI